MPDQLSHRLSPLRLCARRRAARTSWVRARCTALRCHPRSRRGLDPRCGRRPAGRSISKPAKDARLPRHLLENLETQ
jgi:hypothetical protein